MRGVCDTTSIIYPVTSVLFVDIYVRFLVKRFPVALNIINSAVIFKPIVSKLKQASFRKIIQCKYICKLVNEEVRCHAEIMQKIRIDLTLAAS